MCIQNGVESIFNGKGDFSDFEIAWVYVHICMIQHLQSTVDLPSCCFVISI